MSVLGRMFTHILERQLFAHLQAIPHGTYDLLKTVVLERKVAGGQSAEETDNEAVLRFYGSYCAEALQKLGIAGLFP